MQFDNLTIPKFLRSGLSKKASRERIDEIIKRDYVAQRTWAPIRKREDWSVKPATPVMTDHPHLPVKVQVKDPKRAGSTLLATYANMAEFEAKHNKATYPVKGQPIFFENHNVILVTAKPWADKEKNATKREGPKASAVIVNKQMYDSVLAAFTALGLPINKHQKFRAELKLKRKLSFAHEGKKFNFSYPERKAS